MHDLGYNYRASDIHCALGISQLKKVKEFFEAWKKKDSEKDTKAAQKIRSKGLLLVGMPGSGKTTTLTLFGESYGYELFEMNASDARNKKSIKKIGVIHNVLPHERFPLDYLMLKFYLKSLDTMITLSKNSTNSLHKICYKKAIIKQLYHPIEKKKKLNREKSLKILNLDPKNQYLLHFGLVRKYKGLDLLIESMTELIKTNKNLILLIVGEFYSNKEKYLKQITRLKLEKNIKITNIY